MKCQARTWAQVQRQHGPYALPPEDYRCKRAATRIAYGHHACAHHANKPPTFGWLDVSNRE